MLNAIEAQFLRPFASPDGPLCHTESNMSSRSGSSVMIDKIYSIRNI